MAFKHVLLTILISYAVLSRGAWGAETAQPIPLPYDYEFDWKCQRGMIEGKVCDQFPYRDVDAIEGDLHGALLSAAKVLRPTERPDGAAYAFLGYVGSAKVLIGMDSPDNVATYIIFTLVNNRLVDHQLIGIDDMEGNSLERDFVIDKGYRIFVYSRKPHVGIKSPRKLIGEYQIRSDGTITALK